VRPRTLAQMMSTARVYRRLPGYLDEYVVMLFRADEFPDSLALSIDFGDGQEPQSVRRMSGDNIPSWFIGETSEDITIPVSNINVSSSHRGPFFGVEVIYSIFSRYMYI